MRGTELQFALGDVYTLHRARVRWQVQVELLFNLSTKCSVSALTRIWPGWYLLWHETPAKPVYASSAGKVLNAFFGRSERQQCVRGEEVSFVAFLDVPARRNVDTQDWLVGRFEFVEYRFERVSHRWLEREACDDKSASVIGSDSTRC